jgi:phosphatidylglycerol:prolipoprotein diacylglycerol transferase
LDIAIFTVIFGIVGARLYYVLTSLDKYDSLYSMIAIWEGGLAIYGGLIAGALTIFLVCRYKKIKVMKMFDSVAPGVMIAQALGRWGNFFNGEAYGEEVIEGSFLYFVRMGLIPNIESRTKMFYFHPTFLYESLWNITGFILINALYKKKKFDGQIFYMYIAWYGFGRMLIEGLRTDSLYVGVFRISQVVGFICFVVGSLMLTLNLLKSRRARLTALDYDPAYPKFATTASMGITEEETDSPEESVEENTESDPVEEAKTDEHTDVSDKIGKIFNIDND